MSQKTGNRKRLFLLKAVGGLSLGMLLGLSGLRAVGAVQSQQASLWVGGTYMIRNGKVQTDTVKGKTGTAVYDPGKHTLTLKNFSTDKSPGIGACELSGLTLVLEGENQLHGEAGGIHAQQTDTLNITGNGSLHITAGNSQKFGYGIITGGNLNIEHCTIQVKSSSGCLTAEGRVRISNARVKLKRIGVDAENGPGKTYNKRIRYGALHAGALCVTSSQVDAEGINYALGIMGIGGDEGSLYPPEKPKLSADMVAVDGAGRVLRLTKLHWVEDNAYTRRYEYVYSQKAADHLYGFSDAAVRVSLKQKPEKPRQNISCYRGNPKSGKVTYTGPVNRKVKSVTIPAAVNYKGYRCRVTAIAKGAFQNCRRLTTVKLGSNVTAIGAEAFQNCSRLTTVKLGSNVTVIGTKAFQGCTALKKVTLPRKITTMKGSAFSGCKKLSSVTFQGKKLKTVGKAAFRNTKNKIKITVPESRYQKYKNLLKGKGLKRPRYYRK